MPRPKIHPSACPWAALQARGEVSSSQASQYRHGYVLPLPAALERWRALGYDVSVVLDSTTSRGLRAVCEDWPEKVGVPHE